MVWVQGECQLIRDETGRPAFLQGIAFDITHLKKAAQVDELKQAELEVEALLLAVAELVEGAEHDLQEAGEFFFGEEHG